MKVKDETIIWHRFDSDFYQMLVPIESIFRSATKVMIGSEIEPIMTSGRDSKHKEGSKHYTGEAADFRLPGRSIFNREKTEALGRYIVNCINDELGDKLLAILEIYEGKLKWFNSHIHIQSQMVKK